MPDTPCQHCPLRDSELVCPAVATPAPWCSRVDPDSPSYKPGVAASLVMVAKGEGRLASEIPAKPLAALEQRLLVLGCDYRGAYPVAVPPDHELIGESATDAALLADFAKLRLNPSHDAAIIQGCGCNGVVQCHAGKGRVTWGDCLACVTGPLAKSSS